MQRIILGLSLAILLPAAGSPAGETPWEVRVTADRVNVRARPGLDYEVVLQVNAGDVLTVHSEEDDWAGINPPPGACVWIHQDYVKGSRVAVARLNARSGPGINYLVMARLGRGAEVVPIEAFGEWIKIAAPEDATFWVHTRFLASEQPEPPAEGEGETQGWVTMPSVEGAPRAEDSGRLRVTISPHAGNDPRTLPPPEPAESNTVARSGSDDAPTAHYPAPEGLDLVPLTGQGEVASYEGTLSRVKYLMGRPSRFELIDRRSGRRTTVCYVRGNREQLTKFLGKSMRISGREYWAQDVEHPIIVPEKMVLDPTTADDDS